MKTPFLKWQVPFTVDKMKLLSLLSNLKTCPTFYNTFCPRNKLIWEWLSCRKNQKSKYFMGSSPNYITQFWGVSDTFLPLCNASVLQL